MTFPTNGTLIKQLMQHGKPEPFTQESLAGAAIVSVNGIQQCISVDTVQRALNGGPIEFAYIESLARALKVQPDLIMAHGVGGIPPSPLRRKIAEKEVWPYLVRSARESAIAGGMTAQGFYRAAGPKLNMWANSDPDLEQLIQKYRKAGKNPPSKADLVATLTILREAVSLLSHKANELGTALSLLCEETSNLDFHDWLRKHLDGRTFEFVHQPLDWYRNVYNALRVIADAIDGTENFISEIPFFGSAVAILIDEVPSVAAVYVPVHSVVYTAVLPGPRENPADGANATQWDTISGNCVDLAQPGAVESQRPIDREKVAVHFTRSNDDKRRELISKVDAICHVFGGVYALNAGLPAMVLVATGAFGAFVNNWTNPWDVAAGEVLDQLPQEAKSSLFVEHLYVDGVL